jgi:predicted ester cyclase
MTDQRPAGDSAVTPPGAKALATIDAYYACFNQRRFRDAANLFTANAVLEHIPLGQSRLGREGYLHFAYAWVNAFPDVVIDVERVQSRSETLFDVDLVSRGTHLGDLDFGVYLFRPSQSSTSLKLRELLEVQEGKITRSTLSFDISDAVRQLALVDFPELAARLDRIRQLSEALDAARFDAERRRQLVERLCPELDAARRAVRPHYNR